MARTLKVFRTPIGFHDAYVAAPSQKAALEAWGSDANLFARGVAEVVTDDDLTAEPLANPGKVIKRLRGSAEDHFEALPATSKRRASTATSAPARSTAKPAKPKKVVPRPSRQKLDNAEQQLEKLRDAQAADRDDLQQREQAIRAERKHLEMAQSRDLKKLEVQVASVRERYESAVTRWRDR